MGYKPTEMLLKSELQKKDFLKGEAPMKIVKLAYYDEFSCVGPKCIDSCCKHWVITLTKREYFNYKKTDLSPELKAVADTAFFRIRNGNDLQYAGMKLKDNGDCPFLGDDSLCMLQKEKGEQALSFVCSIFPRINSRVGDEAFIYTCDITCPHVVELLIKHPEGLAVTEEEYKHDNPYIEKGFWSGEATSDQWKGRPYLWTIKGAQMDILQNRAFTIPERMLILGFFCQKANEYINRNEAEKINSLAGMMLDNEMCRKIAGSLNAPQSEESAALKSIDIFSKMKYSVDNGNYSRVLKDLFERAAESVGLDIKDLGKNSLNINFNKGAYFKNLEVYRGIESQRPYIIENLMVNLAFAQSLEHGIWLNYFELAVFYNIFKICIPAFLKENWDDTDLAAAITYSAKMVINSKLARGKIAVDFIDHNIFTLPYAAFLIN